MLLNKLLPSVVVSVHSPNDLPTQQLDNIRVTHQSQVTHRGLSYKAVLLSYITIPRETFRCDKRFVVIWEEGSYEYLFDK